MKPEKQILEDALAADVPLTELSLVDLIEPYEDAEFRFPKSQIIEKSNTYIRLAESGMDRPPLLSVVNGAEMVAWVKGFNKTGELHRYAYSAGFANYADWFVANVEDYIGAVERHFFVHGIAKALLLKNYSQ